MGVVTVYHTGLQTCMPMRCESPCNGSPCETPPRIHPHEHGQMVAVVQAAVQTAASD